MPLSKYGRELLLKITQSPPGQIDVSNIPNDVLDDVVDEVGGLLTFHKSLRLNQAVVDELKADETKAANVLLGQVKQAILDGKATLTRGPMGHVVMMPGIEGAVSRPPLPSPLLKSAFGAYQIKVKSLKAWGITYGYRIWLNHALVSDLAKKGSAAAAVLAWLPVAHWIVDALVVAALVLKALDSGNGVYFYITFAGIWWVKPA